MLKQYLKIKRLYTKQKGFTYINLNVLLKCINIIHKIVN